MDGDADAMKIGAETARQPKKIGGLDGRGWVEQIEKNPMTTMPPGAGALVVGHYQSVAQAALGHLRPALHEMRNLKIIAPDERVVQNGITAAINLLGG